MKAIPAEELNKLCDDHWEYIEQVIRNEFDTETEFVIDGNAYCRRIAFHYKSAMLHGFKHGIQYALKTRGIDM